MKKTPYTISLISALLVAVFSVSINALMFYFIGVNIWTFLMSFVIIALLAFFIFYYTLTTFVYSKIKIIYRTLLNVKTRNNAKYKLDFKEDVIQQLSTDVVEWDKERKKQILDLESQDNFRKEFIGNVAHELKTPIFSIQGYILTLLEGAVDDPKFNVKFLERAQKGVERMTNIIEELDEVNKLENGKIELQYTSFDIVQLTREILEALELKASKKEIQLKLKKKYSSQILVYADRGKISQVLTNLIANSINYGIEKGETVVSFDNIENNIIIEVSDNGVGISKEDQKGLFQRFYRVDKSRARNTGGSGLGLAICKHIVENHGHSIAVSSEEDLGSIFSFSLDKK